MEKIKSALYCRVSTRNDDQNLSFELQQKYENEMFEIVEIYGEKASGRELYKRKALRGLLSDVGIEVSFTKEKQAVFALNNKEIGFKNIIVANTSRFGRNVVECKQMIEFLHKRGVTVWFDDLGKFSNSNDIDMTLDILFLLDESVSKSTSKKVKKGLERSKKDGRILPGFKLFGYDYNSKENKFICNEDSKKVEEIFNLYLEGWSIRDLASKYNRSMSRIMGVLDNSRYAGYDKRGIYIGDGTKKRKKIEDIEIFESDKIEPIISIETWRKCQEVKKSRRCGKRGINNNTFPLSSKIICSKCGAKFFHKQTNKKPNSDLWKCRISHNEPHRCNMGSISEKKIIEFLKSEFGFKGIRETLALRIEQAIQEIQLNDRSSLESKIEPLNERLKRIKKLYIMEDMTEDEYLEQKSIFIDELNKYKSLLAELENKEKLIIDLKRLKTNYNKILDEYEKLIKDNPQELFKKISYVKVDEVRSVLRLDKTIPTVTEVGFTEFEPIKEYYGNFIIPKDYGVFN